MDYYQRKTIEIVKYHTLENPVSGKTIAEFIGLKERPTGREGADMRSIIHKLRLSGYPICSSDKGYYWARDRKELSEYVKRLDSRIQSIREVRDALKESYRMIGISMDEIRKKEEEKEAEEFARTCL